MNRSARYFVGQQQPASVHAVEKSRNALGARIYFLNLQKEALAPSADPQIFLDEAIELMAVDGEVSLAVILPNVALVDRNTDQVRHQVGEAGVVVPLDPHHFHPALGIGKLANVGEEFPVLAGEAAKIKI